VKYRHAFHAGNFADVLKHVTLLALLRSLTKKDKGLLALDTHAGRGLYDLASGESRQSGEATGGLDRLLRAEHSETALSDHPEIVDYLNVVRDTRQHTGNRFAYPGSPLVALAALRPQDRLTLIESQIAEHSALREAIKNAKRAPREVGGAPESVTIECADGYARLTAWLPPIERRALVMIDPPYEDTASDFKAAERASQDVLRRLANAVIAIWYPIKQVKDTDAWRTRLMSALPQKAGGESIETLTLELWIHPLDNRVGLNGAGMLIINPPFQFGDRARQWLPALRAVLDPEGLGGCAVR
jgi:23S rRNA (adenine2030-N6)-methyltransferase